jgi:hypothetical protein
MRFPNFFASNVKAGIVDAAAMSLQIVSFGFSRSFLFTPLHCWSVAKAQDAQEKSLQKGISHR